jgi:hypothetical protein
VTAVSAHPSLYVLRVVVVMVVVVAAAVVVSA